MDWDVVVVDYVAGLVWGKYNQRTDLLVSGVNRGEKVSLAIVYGGHGVDCCAFWELEQL